MEAVGLQTFIWNNNLRSAFLLAGFPVLLIWLVYVFTFALIGAGYLPSTGTVEGDAASALNMMVVGAPLAIAVAAIWFVIAYFANQAIIDAATGARVVTRQEEPELYNLLENLCISRGIKTPTLRIIESEALNAYATGLHEGQYSITVTRGIVQALNKDEMEAVLGHELTHVINRDVRTMVIAAVFAGIFSLIAQILYRSIVWGGVRSRRDRRGGGVFILIALAAAFIGYLLAIVIRLALSRRREFVADAGSVELTKNPDAMISALQKISGGHEKLQAPESVRAMFLDDEESGIYSLFATHPPIPARIDALVRYAGGKLPEPPSAGPWGARPAGGPWG